MENLRDLLKEFYPFAKERFGFDKNAKIIFLEDEDNASNPLGKTAYYNPSDYTVSVYVTGRHPKDILRSVSHELVHHTQNCRGEFTNKENVGGEGYAQKDEHLREMEREAYEQGNMCFRDWEDMRKNNLDTNYVNEDGDMSNKDLRNHRLNSHIMNKWGFSSKKEETKEQVKEENGYDDDYELSDLEDDFPDIFKMKSSEDDMASADAEMDADDEYEDEEEDDLFEGAKVYVIATENCGEEATVLEMLDDATAKIQIGDEELVIRQDYLEKINLDESVEIAVEAIEEEAKPDFLDLDGDGDKEEPMKAAAEDAKEDEDEDEDVKEEMEIEDPKIEMTPEVLDMITDKGAEIELAGGAKATKQDDNVWEVSGDAVDVKDGEIVPSRAILRNLDLPKSGIEEEETVEEISSCAGGAVEGAAMASKDDDEDEDEKLEESFSIKSAASNRNKLMAEQVMKAWFNK